jgi:hypothetical protein
MDIIWEGYLPGKLLSIVQHPGLQFLQNVDSGLVNWFHLPYCLFHFAKEITPND